MGMVLLCLLCRGLSGEVVTRVACYGDILAALSLSGNQRQKAFPRSITSILRFLP